ncbi:uncharacterized protein [Ptychodera flava]|uniref:uncharacterized protein n=1 Tax=Ptychodera flava TaxID=63121 RepID=UPI00396A3D09
MPFRSASDSESNGEETLNMAVIGNMSLAQVLSLQTRAQATLKEAMRNERSKRWQQVIGNYRQLLKLVARDRLPSDWAKPTWYNLLMYETHYHIGLALQRLGDHKTALKHYNKAIVAISIPKNGCEAKCNSNSCLHTPLFAKRAFAHAKMGDFRNAVKDSEKAVVLDSKNADVYCIRAMVHNTIGEKKKAVSDLNFALGLNSNHACALVLRGAIDKPMIDEIAENLAGRRPPKLPADHLSACIIKPDAQNFLDVSDFNHPRILDFYDRFLFSLNVPHTVCDYHIMLLPPQFWSVMATASNFVKCDYQTDKWAVDNPGGPGATRTRQRIGETRYAVKPPMSSLTPRRKDSRSVRAFRVSAGSSYTETVSATERRQAYDNAVRNSRRRAKSAPPMRPMSPSVSTAPSDTASSHRAFTTPTGSRQCRPVSAATSQAKTQLSYSTLNINRRSLSPKKALSLANIRVMEKVNIKYAPRMYIKPWLGDRIQPADKEEQVSKFISEKPFVGVGPYK